MLAVEKVRATMSSLPSSTVWRQHSKEVKSLAFVDVHASSQAAQSLRYRELAPLQPMSHGQLGAQLTRGRDAGMMMAGSE